MIKEKYNKTIDILKPTKSSKKEKSKYNKAIELFNPSSDRDRDLLTEVFQDRGIKNSDWFDLLQGANNIPKKRLFKKNKVVLEEIGEVALFKLPYDNVGIYITKYNAYASLGYIKSVNEWVKVLNDNNSKETQKITKALNHWINQVPFGLTKNIFDDFIKKVHNNDRVEREEYAINKEILYRKTHTLKDNQSLTPSPLHSEKKKKNERIKAYIREMVEFHSERNLAIESTEHFNLINGLAAPKWLFDYAIWLKENA